MQASHLTPRIRTSSSAKGCAHCPIRHCGFQTDVTRTREQIRRKVGPPNGGAKTTWGFPYAIESSIIIDEILPKSAYGRSGCRLLQRAPTDTTTVIRSVSLADSGRIHAVASWEKQKKWKGVAGDPAGLGVLGVWRAEAERIIYLRPQSTTPTTSSRTIPFLQICARSIHWYESTASFEIQLKIS